MPACCTTSWPRGRSSSRGGPIDYGTYPQQPVTYFSQDAAPVSMSDIHPGLVEDAWLMAGLGTLVDRLIKTVYQREDAVPMRIGRLFIDVKWGEKNRLLKSFCRRHQHAGTILWPAQGIGIGASGKPFSEYRPEPGAEVGLNWRIAPPVSGDRWVTIDTNFWKTFSASRLIAPINTPGGWELFGRDPREHTLFTDHLWPKTRSRSRPAAGRSMNGSTSRAVRTTTGGTAWWARLWPPR